MSPSWRLLCGWMTLFVVGIDLFVVSPLLPDIAREFALPAASAGLSVTVFAMTYLGSAPLFGLLADRIGRRRVLIGCLAGFVVANFLSGLTSGFGGLLAARIAAGATASGISPLIYAGVGEAAAPARRATWMSIAVSGLLLALSVGAPIGTIIASALGWRTPFIVLAALSLLLMVANRAVWPADSAASSLTAGALPALQPAEMARRLLPTVLWATALYGVYTYLGVWLNSVGLSASQVAWAIGFYGVGALGGTLLGGRAADRFGSRRTMLASLAGLAWGLAFLGSGSDAEWIIDGLLLVTSVSAQLFFPAQQAALVAQFTQRRALLLALNNSALFLGITLGSLLGGEAMTRSGFRGDAFLCTCIAFIAVVFVATTGRRSPPIMATSTSAPQPSVR